MSLPRPTTRCGAPPPGSPRPLPRPTPRPHPGVAEATPRPRVQGVLQVASDPTIVIVPRLIRGMTGIGVSSTSTGGMKSAIGKARSQQLWNPLRP